MDTVLTELGHKVDGDPFDVSAWKDYLRHILGEGEIVQGSYAGHNHTFLVVRNIVVDITSDQFGGSRVFVGPLDVPWSAKKK